jgi:hypothetical protein
MAKVQVEISVTLSNHSAMISGQIISTHLLIEMS